MTYDDMADVSVSEEDMRLIAAAPDLLETSRALLAHLDYIGMTREEEPLLDALRAAIAKATAPAD